MLASNAWINGSESESAVAAMLASNAWINGSESERESLAESLHQQWSGLWEQVGGWWSDLWDAFKDWIIQPKVGQKTVGQWFSDWWWEMFEVPLPWSPPSGGGPG